MRANVANTTAYIHCKALILPIPYFQEISQECNDLEEKRYVIYLSLVHLREVLHVDTNNSAVDDVLVFAVMPHERAIGPKHHEADAAAGLRQ